MLGLLEDASTAVGIAFRNAGDVILLLDGAQSAASATTDAAREFSSSEYTFAMRGIVAGTPPVVDLDAEKRLIEALLEMSGAKLLISAHDVSNGGAGVAIAECCFAAKSKNQSPLVSAEVSLQSKDPAEFALFGESGGRAVVSVSGDSLARVNELARKWSVGVHELGRVTHGDFCINVNGRPVITSPMQRLRDAWSNSFEQILEPK